MSSGSTKYEQSPEEREWYATQSAYTKQIMEGQQELYPVIMQSLGYQENDAGEWVEQTWEQRYEHMSPLEKIQYNETMGEYGYDVSGNKLTEEQRLADMTPLEKTQYDIEKLTAETQLKALRGEMDVSPALEKSLATTRGSVEEELRRKLGPDYLLSTPGSQAVSNLNESQELIREEARRGLVSSYDAMSSNDQSQAVNKLSNLLTSLTNQNQMGKQGTGVLSGMWGGSGNAAMSGGSSLLNYGTGVSGNQMSAAMQNSANRQSMNQGYVQAGGTIVAAAAAAAAA